jgi:hypothetical protein
MEIIEQLLQKRGVQWGDSVKIVGLSVDNDIATIKKHLDEKKFKEVQHYCVSGAGCTAGEDYGMEGVPHMLIVDKKGKIVFIGHPSFREDLEKDIDCLLRGDQF